MAFSANQSAYNQQHFTIIEIDLPVVNGTCTLGGSDGFGTPLSCEQSSNGTFTHRFTISSAPQLPVSGIWRCVKSITETPTELKSGEGLAARGSLSIKFNDFIGDPNPLAPGVTDEVREAGQFFGKLDARNILQNRDVRIKNYVIVDGVLPDLDTDAETRHYIVESFSKSGPASWTLTAKDELSRFNFDEVVWPPNIGGTVDGAMSSSTTLQTISPNGAYSVDDVVRIGDELLTIIEVFGTGQVRFRSRGAVVGPPQFTNQISQTESPTAKEVGDEVFLCKVYDGANIADLLFEVLTDSGVDSSLIPIADWYAEIAEWHANTEVVALFTESEDVNKVLSMILQSYLLDMWFDPVARKVKLSAVSAWKSSADKLIEGRQIDFDSVKRTESEELRATNALVVYDKPFKSRNDDAENFRKASVYKNPVLETDDYYGEEKDKRFDNNPLIDKTAGDLLVNRYVSRYGITPQLYTWKTQERFRTFTTGDIVDITTNAKQSFLGQPADNQRAQVISIKPNYNDIGRDYTVKALTYEPAFAGGSELVITGGVTDLDLYNQIAGAPSDPVTLTIVFDGATSGSSSTNTASIRAGNFAAGSKLIIILANGADLQAAGGRGGQAGHAFYDTEFDRWIDTGAQPGRAGGTVFDLAGLYAEDVDCDIYFSGPTPSTAYPVANGFIRAPGGGGGSENANIPNSTGNSGGGGAGRVGGAAGPVDFPSNELPLGNQGQPGSASGQGGLSGLALSSVGKGGNWGQNGSGATSLGGAAGKGIIDSGATVILFGEDLTRYINGNGDH